MRIALVAELCAVLLAVACGGGGSGDDQPGVDAGADPDGPPPVAPSCDPFPRVGTPAIPVTPADAANLGQIILDAPAGAMIEFADGVYPVSGDVVMNVSKPLILVSSSRDAAAVVLDGGDGYAAREILQISSSGVTVAHLTIQNAQDHLIHLYPAGDEDLTDITIHGVVLIDAGQHFLKSNANQPNSGYLDAEFVDDVTVSCSSFTLTPAGRAYVPNNPHNSGYPCYTGGIDAHAARGWHVVRNSFDGIYCDVDSLAEHAIHFWHSGRDQLIEQNLVGNCARGIGLGLYWGEDFVERPYPDDPHAADKVDVYVGNYDGIIRNNVVWADVAAFDSGITLDQAIGARVHHNTVVVSGAASGNPIEYRWPNSIVEIRNNLSGAPVLRDGASGTVASNAAPVAGDFVGGGDYHLAGPASTGVDQGEAIPEAGLDLDGQTHDNGPPDLGADEIE